MQKRAIFAIAVVIVIVLIAVYAVHKSPKWSNGQFWRASYLDTPAEVYTRSDGTYDIAAQMALERAEGHHAPTPADHMLAGTILNRNVLAQGTENTPDRQQARDDARRHYAAAMRGLRAPRPPPRPPRGALAGHAATMRGMLGGNNQRQQLQNHATFIDIALDFATTMIPAMFGGPDGEIWLINDGPLIQEAQHTREHVIAERKQNANMAGTPAARINRYLDIATTHTDDPENSHDPLVNGCARSIVARLRTEATSTVSLATVRAEVVTSGVALSDSRPELVEKALGALDRAKNGERTVSISVTDEEAWRLVWARAGDKRNAGNAGKMRQAIFDGLVSCWKPTMHGESLVCVHGRVMRALGSLALLDFDTKNWNIGTLEQLKNEIFHNIHLAVEKEIADAAVSPDVKLAAVAKSYRTASASAAAAAAAELDEATEKEFTARLKRLVDEQVDQNIRDANSRTDNAISPEVAQGIKTEALAAVS